MGELPHDRFGSKGLGGIETAATIGGTEPDAVKSALAIELTMCQTAQAPPLAFLDRRVCPRHRWDFFDGNRCRHWHLWRKLSTRNSHAEHSIVGIHLGSQQSQVKSRQTWRRETNSRG
jgi:hypothetical protein